MRPKLRFKKHSTTILSIFAIAGLLGSVAFSIAETPKALKLIEDGKKKENLPDDASTIEKVAVCIKYGWKPYIPVFFFMAGTIGCIVGADRIYKKRYAALTGAYMILESQYLDYRKKVIDRHGEEEDKKIISAIAADKIAETSLIPINENDEIITFWEPHRSEFIEMTMANFLSATSELNKKLVYEELVTLNDFYDLLGVEQLNSGDILGWSLVWFADGIWNYEPWIEIDLEDAELEDGLKYKIIHFPPQCEPTADAIVYYCDMYSH